MHLLEKKHYYLVKLSTHIIKLFGFFILIKQKKNLNIYSIFIMLIVNTKHIIFSFGINKIIINERENKREYIEIYINKRIYCFEVSIKYGKCI